MTSSILSTKPMDLIAEQQQYDYSAQCQLQWRRGQLLVRFSQDVKQLYLRAVDDEQWLVQCLQHSPVRLVRIDPTVGEATLKRWANACEQANKPVFLWGTVAQQLKGKQSQLDWCLMRLIDAIAALVLLILLSPVMLATAVLIYIYSPGAIFSHRWQVGARGKLFRAIKFRTTEVMDDSCNTLLGRWMCNYRLEELPQLFNVVRGEMSLIAPRPLTLCDAVRLSLEE